MRIAFIVHRLPDYRLFGPAIERALEVGWDVECWHDYSQPRTGLKAYRFPATAGCPSFHAGMPRVRSYAGAGELSQWIERGETNVVVSAGTPASDTAGPSLAQEVFWTCVQEGTLDTFLNHPIHTLDRCNLLALHSPWWMQWAAVHYATTGQGADHAELDARLRARSAFVGTTDADVARLVDPAEVRRRWGIPSGQPVVVLLPFPSGVGKATFWPRNLFAEPSRLRRVLNVARRRQFKYWRAAWSGPTDRAVVAAVREFCDRNGAFLIVKSREKTPIPGYTAAAADKSIYDESYYPSTIIEALSIASLCINYYSSSVQEAAALGVPNLCVTFAAEDYVGDEPGILDYFRRFFTPREGSMFQFAGVSVAVSIDAVIADLPSRRLDAFRVDPAARSEYVRTFLGWDDGRSGERLIDAIGSRVSGAAG